MPVPVWHMFCTFQVSTPFLAHVTDCQTFKGACCAVLTPDMTIPWFACCRRMKGEYVYFAMVIFIAVMLILVVVINYQFGASFFVFLLLVAMLIYCIISTVFLLLAVVGHDE